MGTMPLVIIPQLKFCSYTESVCDQHQSCLALLLFLMLSLKLYSKVYKLLTNSFMEQGKSEGFESCDRPIVRKRPNWVKIGDVLSCVTLKFDG